MSILVKSGGTYAAISVIKVKVAGAYTAPVGVFVKVSGVYQRVDANRRSIGAIQRTT